jgi:hypothetical protein
MPPKLRASSPHSLPPKKLHETLLDPTTTTELGFISYNSSYSFVLYGKRARDACIEVNGISFTQFCMKITIVGTQKQVYEYLPFAAASRQTISKFISTEEAIEKEVRLQTVLDNEFRKKNKRPIVPYVIDECLLSSEEFSRLFSEERFGSLRDNVRFIINSIQENLQVPSRRVHIFFMEYMDNTKYKTLAQRISEWDARWVSQMVTTDYKKKAYQRMAANLACAAGCNVIPYDTYEPNVMLDYYADDVRLIDMGNTFDLHSDQPAIVGLFDEMLKKTTGGDSLGSFPTLDQLNVFFGVTSSDALSEAFKTCLTSFIDLRTETNLTVENIHRNLIMLTFIDFMINRFGLLDMRAISYCKSRFAMESVYGEGSFATFDGFLNIFNPYDIQKYQQQLEVIQSIIQGIINTPPAQQTKASMCAMMGGTFIKRYIPDTLSIRDKSRQRKELTKSRRLYKQGKYYTRKSMRSFKSKPSKHLDRARSLYHVDKIRPTRELSRKTGCSLKGLRQIVKKGEGAYYSSGSRPNQTPQSWGNARLASAITGGNASLVDFHILDKECDHRKPAFRLAQKPRK